MSLINGEFMAPGHQAVLLWAQEAGATPDPYPYVSMPSRPAFSGTVADNLVGYFDIPELNSDEGTKVGYGAGSAEGLYIVQGERTHDLSFTARIANSVFLAQVINGTAGSGSAEFGAADYCFWVGQGNPNGWLDALRFCKNATTGLSFRAGSAQELTANMSFWGLARETGITVKTLSLTDLASQGPPLTWENLTSVQIAGVEYRDQIVAFDYSLDWGLERKNPQPQLSDDTSPLSRTSIALMSHYKRHSLSMTFESARLAAALVNPVLWGSTGTIVLLAANGSKTFRLTINAAALLRRSNVGGEASSEMNNTVTAAIRNVVAASS